MEANVNAWPMHLSGAQKGSVGLIKGGPYKEWAHKGGPKGWAYKKWAKGWAHKGGPKGGLIKGGTKGGLITLGY